MNPTKAVDPAEARDESGPARPNILLITADQLRPELVGSNEAWSVRAPNLDALKASGTTLSQATSVCPICMPARFSWMTGLYPSQGAARLMRNCHDWPLDRKTYVQGLKQQGYHCALVGKLHSLAGLYRRDVVAHEDEVRGMGFDDVVEVSGKTLLQFFDCRYSRYLDEQGLLERYRGSFHKDGNVLTDWLKTEQTIDYWVADQACQRLAQRPADRPWFMHVSFCNPHPLYDPPEEYARRHEDVVPPSPAGSLDEAGMKRAMTVRRRYASLVELLDDQIGRVLASLSPAVRENTVVVFASDHGDQLGDCGLWGKGVPNESAVRTPIVVSWPGRVPSGREMQDPVMSVDLPVTLCEIAGADVSDSTLLPNTPGRSFLPYLLGQCETHREYAYAEAGQARSAWRMVRTAAWKLVCRDNQSDELFDLANDPDEQQNVIDNPAHREELRNMQRRLIEAMSGCVSPNQDRGKAVLTSLDYLHANDAPQPVIDAFPLP